MKILCDTHCWLWQLADPGRLNPTATAMLVAAENEVYLSVASMWEIVIKHALGKLTPPQRPGEYVSTRIVAMGNLSLPIERRHVFGLEDLPPHHRDPFDRVLVAQARVDGLQLLTADRVMTRYDVPVVWAGTDPP